MTAPSPGSGTGSAAATQDWWGTEEACVRYGDKLALDHVTFRATLDTLCVISACPMDLNACNGGHVTDLHVRVHNEFA